MRIICEYTDKGNNTNSYMELKRLYNTEVQIPSGYTTDTFLDTVEMLEDRGISFEVYYNTTDDGCSIFYNETAPKEVPVTASKQLTYAEVRRLISGIAFGKYDKSVAPAKISSFIRKMGFSNGRIETERDKKEFMSSLSTCAHGLTRNRLSKFIGDQI